MDGWALGVKIGYANIGSGRVRNPVYSSALVDIVEMAPEQAVIDSNLREGACTPLDRYCTSAGRSGFYLGFPLQLGGSGVGLRFEPFLTFADTATSYGVYVGPTFEFRIASPLYLGFGFGLKSAWVEPDGWRYAVDLHGRVPLTATLYATDRIALVFEVGLGGGASFWVNQPIQYKNPLTGKRLANGPNMTMGFARMWDLSLGIRFP